MRRDVEGAIRFLMRVLVAFNMVVFSLGVAAYVHAAFPDKFPAPTPAK